MTPINKPTAWMIRSDGLDIPVIQHIYGSPDDLDETLYAAEWLCKNTASPETQKLVLRLIAAYGSKLTAGHMNTARAIVRDIRKKSYIFLTEAFVMEHCDEIPWNESGDADALASQVITALNQEFLRARYGGMYSTKPGCRDMYFRISSHDFDWKPIIEDFLYRRRKWIDTVTVVRDEESTGQKFYYKDEKGQPVKRRSVRPGVKAEEDRQMLLLSKLIQDTEEFYSDSLWSEFCLSRFQNLAVRAFDYIATYMSGPYLDRKEAMLIRVLENLAVYPRNACNLSEDELDICQSTASGLLDLLEGDMQQKPEGRRLAVWYTLYLYRDEQDRSAGMYPAEYREIIDLDDFENELKRAVKQMQKSRGY